MTRFTGERGFLAPWWKALRELATPPVVDSMTPSQVAAVLGLDEQAAIRAVPYEDRPVPTPVPVDAAVPTAPTRVHTLVMSE